MPAVKNHPRSLPVQSFRHFFALVLFFCLTAAAHAETQTLSDLVASYEKLRLGDAHTATNVAITSGHATYTLPSGTVSPVFAGDKQVGLFLAGNGTFHYETTNKDEFPALRYNGKHGGVSFAAAPASHLLAYHAVDNPSARLLIAEIQGATSPFIHQFDDAHDNDETLNALLRPPMRMGRFKDSVYPVQLSRQSIGRGNRAAPPVRALLTDVDVNLVGLMNEQGTLTVTETIVPQKRAANAFTFSMRNTLYMESQSRDRHLNIKSITDEKGRKLSFVHDAGDLVVGLAEAAPAGKPVKLRFDVDGDFLYRQDKTNYWELGIWPWFPWLRLHEHAFTFHSVIKVEKPFVIFASGKTIRRVEEGNYNVLETKLDNPVAYVAALAGKYQFSEEVRKGVMIRVASFINKNETAYKKIRDVAEAAIDYYPFFLGPFPFDEINVIEKDSHGEFAYGQAPAGIVFITSEAFRPMQADLNDMVQGVNGRFAHELAHMYFGSQVRRTTDEEQWLDEAFAEYASALFLKAGRNGAGDYQRAFLLWKDGAKVAGEQSTIPMANRLNNPGDPLGEAMTRQQLIYFKGAYLLAALHKELGDQLFLTFLKSYQKSFRWKQATTKDVIDLLTFLTKKDYAPFFDQYYYGTALPDVKLK
jgi:hypothetical protein